MKPELGLVFLGSQGDMWDAQKDMSAALYGSLLCTVLIVLIQTRWSAPHPRVPPSDRPLEAIAPRPSVCATGHPSHPCAFGLAASIAFGGPRSSCVRHGAHYAPRHGLPQ